MELKDIGEFGFIKRFAHKFDKLIGKEEMGIGDDCALLPLNDTETYVVTTDLLIEDIHFLKTKITPEDLGHKSLAVSLSDIAAMGAYPKFSFLSLGVPKQTSVEYLDAFMNGYQKLSEKYHTPLMGGDTTKSSDKLMINVVVVGQCKKSEVRLRSMAKDGDLICVTGNLGDSAGGLHVLLNNAALTGESESLVKKHHNPEPRIKEGIWLSNQNSVHAMMDISDGISSDLMHILNASQKSANIDVKQLPISSLLQNMAKKYAWNEIELASSGGEDYELLFTVDRKDIDRLHKEYKSRFTDEISVIGEIKQGQAEIKWFENGNEISINKSGFNHFANS
ncbi:thiamine-phosphate kinase [Labilibaculum filiforme]|uniref:Thiamine-monophosphate kinase n=1 Tax=Labilibaculum filiforme TaxID=1940526 RepID=A0A2N3HVG8_9BACT|nr:thiamine-phosphate kinase [Labilibaculum filiforme]PKQ62049.1 thiamine-phosphate kinase [Labilibaculum filiforme]